MRKIFKPYKPVSQSGNLYYARLKTELGILYKLGFTTFESTSDRLNYQNLDTSHSIDEVLFFQNYDNAWDIEQQLHQHFKNYALFSGLDESMPLFKNGQSELYAKDILGIDTKYSEEQMEGVLINIEKIYLTQYNFSEDKIKISSTAMKEKFDNKRAAKIASIEYSKNFEARNKKLVLVSRFIFNCLSFMIGGAYKTTMKLFGNKFKDTKSIDVMQVIEDIQNKVALKRDEVRILRQAKMNALLKEERNKERSNFIN